MNLLEELWNGYVLQEGQKVQQRLNATGDQQAAGLGATQYQQQPQAQVPNTTATPGFQIKHLDLWIAGIGVAAVAWYMLRG